MSDLTVSNAHRLLRAGVSGLIITLIVALSGCSRVSEPQSNLSGSTAADAILTFQGSDEILRFPVLGLGPDALENVVFRLKANGSWELLSRGPRRTLRLGEIPDAALIGSDATEPTQGWRPSQAIISIRRLHIEDKVFLNTNLYFEQSNWRFDEYREETQAVSIKDFDRNKMLTATHDHHVVLQSHPDTPKQSFPITLESRRYNFCFDNGDHAGDSFSLTDASGKAVFQAKAGEPCKSVDITAGKYIYTHQYGQSGNRSVLFFRPKTERQVTPVPRGFGKQGFRRVAMSADKKAQFDGRDTEGEFPEYWSIFAYTKESFVQYGVRYPDGERTVFVNDTGGYLGANIFPQLETQDNNPNSAANADIYSIGQSCNYIVDRSTISISNPLDSSDFTEYTAFTRYVDLTRRQFGKLEDIWGDKHFFKIRRKFGASSGPPAEILNTRGCFKKQTPAPGFCFDARTQTIASGLFCPKPAVASGGTGVFAVSVPIRLRLEQMAGNDYQVWKDLGGDDCFANNGPCEKAAELFFPGFASAPVWFEPRFPGKSFLFQDDVLWYTTQEGRSLNSNEIYNFKTPPGLIGSLTDLQYIKGEIPEYQKRRFRVDYRFFPNGVSPNDQQLGMPMLADDEVALFNSDNCSGPFTTLVGDQRRTPFGTVNAYQFKSMLLGNRSSAYILKKDGASLTDSQNTKLLNIAGCIKGLDGSRPAGSPIEWPAVAVVNSVADITLTISNKNCDYCDLRGAVFDGMDISNASFIGANLSTSSFVNSYLARANFTNANMQGANLSFSNLDQANLCSANFSNSLFSNINSSLSGAFLRNVNASGANFSGADLSFVSFFSSTANGDVTSTGACTEGSDSCSSFRGRCANAANATFINANLTNAYLAKLNLSGTDLRGVAMTQAVLIGASLVNAKLANIGGDGAGGSSTSLAGASLQFANLSGAVLDNVSFTQANLDPNGSSCFFIRLRSANTRFKGFEAPGADGKCSSQPSVSSEDSCVQLNQTASPPPFPILPISARCPNGSNGPCRPDAWLSPQQNVQSCDDPNVADACLIDKNTCW